MHVVGVEQRNEDVDVEQRDWRHERFHSSSRRSLTNFIVGRGDGWPALKKRHAVSDARGSRPCQCPPRQFGQHFAGRRPPCAGQFLHRLEHVIVEVEGGSHASIITHHASRVNPTRGARQRSSAKSQYNPASP